MLCPQNYAKDQKYTMAEVVTGSCHCGNVEFEVKLEDGIAGVSRCDCSYCRRRQVAAMGVPISSFTVTKGEKSLSLYQWGTKTAKHYFCSNCGIYTHHRRRSDPEQYGFNIACLDGVDPYSFDVRVTDGINHPADLSKA